MLMLLFVVRAISNPADCRAFTTSLRLFICPDKAKPCKPLLIASAASCEPLGVVCGRGRNPTLRLWPAIFSGEIDVFPSERRNMGQEIGR